MWHVSIPGVLAYLFGDSELVPAVSLTVQKTCPAKHMLSWPCAVRACRVRSLTPGSSGHRVFRSLRFRELEGLVLHDTDSYAGGAAPLLPADTGQPSSHVPCRCRQRRGLAGVWARGAGTLHEGSRNCRARPHVCALPQMLRPASPRHRRSPAQPKLNRS